MTVGFFGELILAIVCLLVGAVIGFFLARHYLQKYMQKNPPINEQMIRAMLSSMGRTPSQKQVNQTMKEMTKYM